MSSKYCANCKQVVNARRHIGVGTFILVIVTGGLWLLAILLYSKRCPLCRDTAFVSKGVAERSQA